MSNDSSASGSTPAVPVPSASLPEVDRVRLIQCYQRGTQNISRNIDYAIEMFGTCAAGDPSSPVYLQSLLGCLKKKFEGKSAGGLATLMTAPARGGLRKLLTAGKMREVISQGITVIKVNPRDANCLLIMADACAGLGFSDTQRVYLKAAIDAGPKDPEVNRRCAAFLAARGEYDQAIACWNRVAAVKSLADEAEREIKKLQVAQTINAGKGLLGRQPAAPAAQKSPSEQEQSPAAVDRRSELEQSIAQDPANIDAYLELADILERDASLEEAEKVLATALDASGNELKVCEHVEDRHLRWARHRVVLAEKRVSEDDTPENRRTLEQLRSALLKREIEIYSARATRYPENMTWKYELAMRLKAAGNHAEAIKHFQETLNDARRKGAIALELGECFQKIRQYHLAMLNYKAAIESLSDRELELRKRALYRAGVLAAGLDDVDVARKYLSTLAEMDFGYRDVAQRLDKLSPAKDKGKGS